MSKRPGDIIISTPVSKVRRRLNFDSPYTSRAAVPTVRGISKRRSWTYRPMYRKPRMYRMFRTPDIPRGCEGPCKVQSYEQRDDVKHVGIVRCVSDVTRGSGLTHRVGKRFCIKSIYILGKVWMDENIKKQNHTNNVMFFLVRDRRPTFQKISWHEFLSSYNEPSTATIKNDLRDRYQVLRKFSATVIGGPSGCKEQTLVKRFFRVNNHVVYSHQEEAKYANHTENALLLYMACTHASNPVYATLKIRIYFYDAVTN
ncbi:coat protein [Ageratum leaf curl Cameroon virus [CM:AGFG24:2009]]|uniref:Capsid protein n=2 Tax=Begomovirus TaxID=10814 RepID=F8LG79_9GEMI|nr:coat protein [Ageratum leaf curl Cameroon virus [CM:AGFG24:2009]]CCC14815.1 coat protein [Ageratum leaf curl Cameroon virus [CM:AGFG14:2009]]